MFSKDKKEIDEDIKVVFVVEDRDDDHIVNQTLEYSMKYRNISRYIDHGHESMSFNKDKVGVVSYDHITNNMYNFNSDLDYLEAHNMSIISTKIKQNKKTRLEGFRYDFSRTVDIDGDYLAASLLKRESSFDEFLVLHLDYLLKSGSKVSYEIN